MVSSNDSSNNSYSIRVSRIVQPRQRRVRQSGYDVRPLRQRQMYHHHEASFLNRDYVVYLLEEALSISTPSDTINTNGVNDEENRPCDVARE